MNLCLILGVFLFKFKNLSGSWDMTPKGFPHSDTSGSKPARRLPEVYRSHATSFIAFWCQGILHTPLMIPYKIKSPIVRLDLAEVPQSGTKAGYLFLNQPILNRSWRPIESGENRILFLPAKSSGFQVAVYATVNVLRTLGHPLRGRPTTRNNFTFPPNLFLRRQEWINRVLRGFLTRQH